MEYVDISPEQFEAKMTEYRNKLYKYFVEDENLKKSIIGQLEALKYE